MEFKDEFPYRSPLVLVDYLLPFTRDKSYLEIGTRHGDHSRCMSRFARSVTAIEIDPPSCSELKEDGINVVCKCFESITNDEFPRADVIFWWPPLSFRDNEPWLLHASRLVREQGRTALAVIAFDANDMTNSPDLNSLRHMISRFQPSVVDRVFFDEALPGREVVHERKTGITNGRWGVYHVAQFPLPLANVTFNFRPSRYNGYFNGTAEQELYRRVVQVGHRKESCEALQAKLYNLSALQSHTRRRLRL